MRFSAALRLAARQQAAAVINNSKAHENQRMDQEPSVFILSFFSFVLKCEHAFGDNSSKFPSGDERPLSNMFLFIYLFKKQKTKKKQLSTDE